MRKLSLIVGVALMHSFSPCYALLPDLLTISNSASNTYTVSWHAKNNCRYQLQSSLDGLNWSDLGSPFTGTGSTVSIADGPLSDSSKHYRLRIGAVRPGFTGSSLERNDDGASPQQTIGFSINFLGQTRSSCYVNNNGNITFGYGMGTFTPSPLQTLGREIIAPFWADVDTSNLDSDLVTYGTGTVDGRAAFGANYVNVGYYVWSADKLNSFQVILINRSDTGSGNFDIEFNYSILLWESGSYSTTGGVNGLGGFSARAGISNGSNRTLELTDSGVNGKFLDSSPTGLVYQSRNSTIPGRFIFQVRSGVLLGALQVDAGNQQSTNQSSITLLGSGSDPSGGTVTLTWTQVSGPATSSIASPNSANTTVQLGAGNYGTYVFQLTAKSSSDNQISAADSVSINYQP